MLFVLFYLGGDSYALDSRQIVEVVPMVTLKPLPRSPIYLAGLFKYRGRVIPVIDLRALIRDAPCNRRLSTRILVVDYPARDGSFHSIGLIAERIMETISVQESELVSPGIEIEETPYLGKILCREHEMIQCVRVERLLPEFLRAALFTEQEGSDAGSTEGH